MKTPRELGFRMPAEWEPHVATWLAWPHNVRDWPGKFGTIPWVFAEMARALCRGERVRFITQGDLEQARASHVLRSAGVDLAQIDFVRAATDRSWTRDFMPLCVVRTAKRGSEMGAVKWRFNGWARYANHKSDEAAGQSVAKRFAKRAWSPRIVLEGGAIDVDGEGTLMATEECLLTGRQARSRELGKAGIERALVGLPGRRPRCCGCRRASPATTPRATPTTSCASSAPRASCCAAKRTPATPTTARSKPRASASKA